MAKYSSRGWRLYFEYLSGIACSIGSQSASLHIRYPARISLGCTYAEELDVVKDLVVESKVVAGDQINTSILLDLPVLSTETLALAEELIARDLSTPISLSSLLQVTETSHAREAENRAARGVSSVSIEKILESKELEQ